VANVSIGALFWYWWRRTRDTLLLLEQRRGEAERVHADRDQHLNAKVFDSSNEAVIITDVEQRIVAVNPAFTRITGYFPEEVLGRKPSMLASGRHPPSFYEQMWQAIQRTGHWQGDIWNRRKSGETFPEWETISAVRDKDGKLTHYVALFSDISERKAAEDQLVFVAYHDALTGLPNRVLMQDRLSVAVAAARRNNESVALLVVDLDRFKEVNDWMGHLAGDELLRLSAKRLQVSVREADTVGRLGGDEFMVVLPGVKGGADAAQVARKILATIGTPFFIEGSAVNVTASIGIALFPADGDDIEALVRSADAAMYRVKRSGRNAYCFFSSDTRE
jgi:diguanylate cyclase (GGDEF)-like protein/PAS domain S-box-containing protein